MAEADWPEGQDERIEKWKAEVAEHGRLRNAYREVYDDMLNCLHVKALGLMKNEEAKDAILHVIECAVRLAYCCTLTGDKTTAFIRNHEQRFYRAFRSTIGVHQNVTKQSLKPVPPALRNLGRKKRS